MRIQHHLLAFLVATGAMSVADARVYKWVDDEGNVQYSQTKPRDREAQTVNTLPSGTTDDNARRQLDSLRDKADTARKDREFARDYGADTQARDERLRKNCETARENLRILETASRIQDTDAQGNRYFLDEASKQAKIDETRRQIEDNCP